MKNLVPFSWRYVALAGVCVLVALIGVTGYRGISVQLPDLQADFEMLAFEESEGVVEEQSAQPDLPPNPEGNNLVYLLITGLLLFVLVLFLATAIRTGKNFLANRRLYEPVERAEADSDPDDALTEVLIPEVTRALDHALSALDGSLPPRNAIVEAWRSLELAVEAVGFERVNSDTATDFVTRALRDLPLDSAALDGFLRLYHLARFTEHEMFPEQKRKAHGYLTTLRENLDNIRYTPVSPHAPNALTQSRVPSHPSGRSDA
jgi:hypothetical protein